MNLARDLKTQANLLTLSKLTPHAPTIQVFSRLSFRANVVARVIITNKENNNKRRSAQRDCIPLLGFLLCPPLFHLNSSTSVLIQKCVPSRLTYNRNNKSFLVQLFLSLVPVEWVSSKNNSTNAFPSMLKRLPRTLFGLVWPLVEMLKPCSLQSKRLARCPC